MGQTCESKGNKKEMIDSNQVLIKCKSTRDLIGNNIKILEDKEKKTREKAKECLRKKDKDRAKFYLKECKAIQKRIKIREGQLDIVEDQIMNIENAKTAQEAMIALQKGNAVLSDLSKEVKIEDLEKEKEKLEELKDKDKEIGDALKEKINDDTAECEEEFEKLAKEVQEEQANNKNNNIIDLPKVSNNEIKVGDNQNKNVNINNKQIKIF